MDDRTLLLMRHSEAGSSVTGSDADRDLSPRGVADSRAAGRWLADQIGPLDAVVCSSALRARRTWRQMAEAGAEAVRVETLREVYQASTDGLLGVLRALDDGARTVLLLGHAPGVPRTAALLAAGGADPVAAGERLDRGFPTTTIARLRIAGSWAELGGAGADLVDVVTPRGTSS